MWLKASNDNLSVGKYYFTYAAYKKTQIVACKLIKRPIVNGV